MEVPGFDVSAVYDDGPSALKLAVGAPGELYMSGGLFTAGVASESWPAGLYKIDPEHTAPTLLYRFEPDPYFGGVDANVPIVVDRSGAFSGRTGAVLLARRFEPAGGGPVVGEIDAFVPGAGLSTESTFSGDFEARDLTLDRSGRLLVLISGPSVHRARLVALAGAVPTELVAAPLRFIQSVTEDHDGQLFIIADRRTGNNAMTIEQLAADGTSLNPQFAAWDDTETNDTWGPVIRFGPGGDFGDFLYVFGRGRIVRYDRSGQATPFLNVSDAYSIRDMQFDGTGALYVGGFRGQLWRVTPTPPKPAGGIKLVLRRKDGSPERARFMTIITHAGAIGLAGSLGDPQVHAGTMRLVAAGDGGFDSTYDLPAGGWKAVGRGKRRGYRFRGSNPDLSVTFLPGRITIEGTGAPFSRPIAGLQSISVVVTISNLTTCATFDATRLRITRAGISAKAAPPPASCPAVSAPSTAR